MTRSKADKVHSVQAKGKDKGTFVGTTIIVVSTVVVVLGVVYFKNAGLCSLFGPTLAGV